MTTYSKITDYAAKDALLTGNPSKIVKGTEIGAEFDAIAVADASNVKGPTSAVTDNAIVRWDTTTGRIVQNSSASVSDTGDLTVASIGVATPGTGKFTTLEATGNVTVSGGTANGVPYLNASKVLTSGAALTFDGTNLGVGGAPVSGVSLNVVQTASNYGVRTVSASGASPYVAAVSGDGYRAGFNTGAAAGPFDFKAFDSQPMTWTLGTSEQMRLTSTGLGLGVTPSAWNAAWKSFEIGGVGNGLVSNAGADTRLYMNTYYTSGGINNYGRTAAASLYVMASSGQHQWFTAPSGTAGTAITFKQSLAVGNGTTLALEGATSAAGTGIAFPATQLASSDANTLDDYRESTYTATATGMTTSPTGTVSFVKVGNSVTMEIPNISGTSNATTFTLTGMPTVCRPSASRTVPIRTADNGTINSWSVAVIDTAGVITLYKDANGTAFTASGNKQVGNGNVSYII